MQRGSKKGEEGDEGKKNFLPSSPSSPFLLPFDLFKKPSAKPPARVEVFGRLPSG